MKLDDKLKLRPSQIVWGIILLLAAIFLIRVAAWEHDYYNGMEGTPRAVAISNLEESSTADETEITEEQISEYTVPATHPRYITIEKLGVKNARVLSLGLTKSGAFAVPTSIYDAGWYNASATPGSGGTILLDGHNGGPTKAGIFKNLPDLSVGDIITIENGAGDLFQYSVQSNQRLSLTEARREMVNILQPTADGQESVVIISCSGDWDKTAKTYDHRQFVRATKL